MATYTAPTTRASGYLVTAANWNTDIVENIKYLKDAPTFDGAVTASSTLTVANNVGIAATKKLYLDGVAMSGDTYISESASNVLSLYSGNVETKLTSGVLTASGFGAHAFSSAGSTFNHLDIINTTSGTGAGTYINLTSGTNTVYLQAQSQGYTTSGHVVQSGAVLEADGSGGLSIISGHASGAIRFYSGGTTERMRMLTTGQIVMGGNTSALQSGYLTIDVSAGTYNALVLNDNSSANGGTFQVFSVASGTACGSVTRNAATNAVLYNTTSDARLKRSHGRYTDVEALRRLVIHDAEFVAGGARYPMVMAQEAHQWVPEAIAPGSEGDDVSKPWSADYGKFTPRLIVGWQQHDATIQQLAARIAALEAAQESK